MSLEEYEHDDCFVDNWDTDPDLIWEPIRLPESDEFTEEELLT